MSQIQNRFKVGYLQIYGYQQQSTANIGHRVCITVNFVFISSISLARGEFKMLNSQVACAQKFQTKNNFFGAANKYGMLLLICKNFRKNYTYIGNTEARPLKIQYFPFRAVLKMHNCFSLCL